MSAIHNALQSSQASSSSQTSLPFNPLNRPTTPAWHWFGFTLAAILLILSFAMLLWPKQSQSENASLTLTPAIPSKAASTPKTQEPETKPELSASARYTAEDINVSKPSEETAVAATVPLKPITPVTAHRTMSEAQKTADPKTFVNLQPAIDKPPKTNDEQDTFIDAQTTQLKTTQLKTTHPPVTNAVVNVADAKQDSALPVVPTNPVNVNAHSDQPRKEAESLSGIRDSINQWQQEVEVFLANGEIEQAEAKLKTWITLRPDDAQPRLWLARIYINNGVYLAAEPLLQSIDSTDSNALLGVVYERTGRAEQAVHIFEALYRHQPENYRWLLFWAINSENSNQVANARALYQTYMTRFSTNDASLTAFVQQRLRRIQGQ